MTGETPRLAKKTVVVRSVHLQMLDGASTRENHTSRDDSLPHAAQN
jgi:hypothetical protein